MAKKGFLKTGDESFLPITRGELVVDSSGDPAFFSDDFIASSEHPGLMSIADKEKLDSIDTTRTQESLTLTIDSGSTENYNKYTFDGSAAKQLNIQAGNNVSLATTTNNLRIDVAVPTSLPANGGNADTVDNKHASDFVLNAGDTMTGALTTNNFLKITAPASDGTPTRNAAIIRSEVVSSGANKTLVHIGSNYGYISVNENNTAKPTSHVDAIGIYRGVIGVGGTFTYDTLRSNQSNNISLEAIGSVKALSFIENGQSLSDKYQPKGSQDHYKNSVTSNNGAAQTPKHGESFTIPNISVNANGHVTNLGTTTVTLPSIDSGEMNVQSDWNETDTSSDAYIKNKPIIPVAVTSLPWSQIDNKPTEFNPAAHKHVSNDITIAKYSIASGENIAIQNNDTLTTALGKLEKTASTAYLWYKSITQEDTDDVINKWHEIVEFVNSITDSEEITNAFVTIDTDQDITGLKTFKPSNDEDAPFAVSNSVKVENLNAALLDGHTADEFIKTDSAYWANLPIQTDEDLETEPVFGSVTANTYILSTAGPEITLSENSTKSGIVELTVDNTPEIVLDTRADIPTLRPANTITEGEDNTNMKLGDEDYKWSEVCASTFRVDSPTESDSENLVRPLHINDEGVITRSDYTVGSDTQPVYMSAGCLVPLEESVGNVYKGVYLSNGEITPMVYSLKANVNSGTAGKLVKYTDANTLGAATTTMGSVTKGIYLNAGTPALMTYSLNATVNSGTAGKLVYYSKDQALSAFDDAGYQDTPVYIKDGIVTPVSLGSSTSELYLVGVKTRSGDSTGNLNQFHVGNQGYQAGVRMVNGTTVYAKGGFYETSDERLKNFTGNVEIDFDSLSKIPKKYFTWVNSETEARQIGTSAQELQKLYPELVEEDNSGTLHVAYDKLSIVALKAVDDLYNLVKDLKASQDDLIARLELLESKV